MLSVVVVRGRNVEVLDVAAAATLCTPTATSCQHYSVNSKRRGELGHSGHLQRSETLVRQQHRGSMTRSKYLHILPSFTDLAIKFCLDEFRPSSLNTVTPLSLLSRAMAGCIYQILSTAVLASDYDPRMNVRVSRIAKGSPCRY